MKQQILHFKALYLTHKGTSKYIIPTYKWKVREGMKTPSKTYLGIKADNPFSLKSDQNLSSSYNITIESYI